MYRRALLAVVATASTAGCLQTFDLDPSFTADALLLNYTESTLSGEVEVARDDEHVYSFTFAIPGRGTDSATPTSTPTFEEHGVSLPEPDTYGLSVTLESGRSASHQWTADEDHGLQIELHPEKIRFKVLEKAAP